MLALVVTLHGELTMAAGGLFQRERWAQQTMRDSLREADYVTACSERTLVEAEEWFGSSLRAKGEVIHNGIALEPVQSAPHPHPRSYVLAIGRHVPQKGFDVLLRAFAALRGTPLPEFDLILAGDGPEHAALRALAAELGVAGRVHFPGRVDHAEALRLFAGCLFFVLPSRLEPFGLVNLEAMAAGRAVVASRVGGVPEIVLHGQTGFLVPPNDVAALAHTMGRVAANASLRQYLGDAGRERVKSFAWPAAVDRYFKVYEHVLGRQTDAEFAGHKEAA